MANHNPNLKGLNEGRGKRPRLNNDTVAMRMSSETKEILTRIAVSYVCLYAGKGHIPTLLDKIARKELIVVLAPPPLPTDEEMKARHDAYLQNKAKKDNKER